MLQTSRQLLFDDKIDTTCTLKLLRDTSWETATYPDRCLVIRLQAVSEFQNSLCQNGANCKTVLMKMRFICMRIKYSHLASLWNRGLEQLGKCPIIRMESFFSRLEINVLAFFVKLNSSTCSFNVNGGFPLFPKNFPLHNTASLVTALATTF